MTEELIKHHKVKAFSRKNMMDFAKVIRNCNLRHDERDKIAWAIAAYLEKEDMFFDRQRFLKVADGRIEDDHKTKAYSTVKEKHNGII
ncbi:MAG TPA: hypothetical protein PLT55_04335 [Acidimicrobiia bacterium]|nr:hypothetical protein [Acidimicrobiia bacterium]